MNESADYKNRRMDSQKNTNESADYKNRRMELQKCKNKSADFLESADGFAKIHVSTLN
jgi:hypothetical protein